MTALDILKHLFQKEYSGMAVRSTSMLGIGGPVIKANFDKLYNPELANAIADLLGLDEPETESESTVKSSDLNPKPYCSDCNCGKKEGCGA